MYDDDYEVRKVYVTRSPSFAEPSGSISHSGPSDKFSFSQTELKHLGVAYIVLVLCFSIVLSTGFGGILFGGFYLGLFIFMLPVSLIAVGLGFVLHEMAHKFTAQHYGCWSEFRYDQRGLMMALFISAVIGFVWAAPGVTYHSGRITSRQGGIISLAGPVTNMTIAGILLPMTFISQGNPILWYYIILSGFIIAFLGFFNLLPINPLDGSKVWRWDKGIYIISVVASLAILAFYYISLIAPGYFF